MNYPASRLKHLLPASEQIVERILEVWCRLRELTPHLRNVFLVALLDFILEELFERSIAETVLPLLRKVRDQVGHQRARKTLRLRVRIVREERIDGRAR